MFHIFSLDTHLCHQKRMHHMHRLISHTFYSYFDIFIFIWDFLCVLIFKTKMRMVRFSLILSRMYVRWIFIHIHCTYLVTVIRIMVCIHLDQITYVPACFLLQLSYGKYSDIYASLRSHIMWPYFSLKFYSYTFLTIPLNGNRWFHSIPLPFPAYKQKKKRCHQPIVVSLTNRRVWNFQTKIIYGVIIS